MLAGLVLAGTVLVVGAAVFVAGIVRIRNAAMLKNQEMSAVESLGTACQSPHESDNKNLIDVDV